MISISDDDDIATSDRRGIDRARRDRARLFG
jgi:hypothetical protein